MRVVAIAGLMIGTVLARADVVQLTTGQQVRGRVRAFANMNFEVQSESRGLVRLSSAAVKSIEFEPGLARLDTRTQGVLEGTVTRYEKASFLLRTRDNQSHKVAITFVTSATFGGGSSKDIDQVRGGDLEKYLVAGQVTIVDFYADWCGPCRFIGPHLEKLATDDDEVVLRKVNIDQNRALAQKYGVRAIPHINIYDKQAKLVGTVVGASKQQVDHHVRQAKTRPE